MKSTLLAPLALAAALPLAAHAAEAPTVAAGNTLLTVTAEGRSTRTPDLATFSTGVASTAKTASAAMAANAAAMNRVIAALKAQGVAPRDIQTANLSLNPQYEDGPRPDNRPPRVVGYQASNTVAVRARDLAKMGAVIDTLVNAGANQVNGPDFSLDNPDAALDEARLAAMKSARARADLYAKAAGLHVLRVLSIAESGGYQPQPRVFYAAKAMAMDAAPSPVEAGEVAMNVNVTIQYELAP
ncbi:MAG: SIMPL domain-containing protein [Sphingomonadales bacterium]|nr:SIMPL domain-containing protein [Sphingomonadales bacterium]